MTQMALDETGRVLRKPNFYYASEFDQAVDSRNYWRDVALERGRQLAALQREPLVVRFRVRRRLQPLVRLLLS